MDISGKIIWQQASGDTDRNYSDLCIKWGVILNGPGKEGQFPDCVDALRANGISWKKISDLRRFSEWMKDGDLVVLRLGTAKVLAVGQIVGQYEWHDEFGDVDGWNIQHVRRVRWLWSEPSSPKEFDSFCLKMGDTTQKLNPGPVTQWLSSLVIPGSAHKRSLAQLPAFEEKNGIDIEEISEFLFDHGVASISIKNLVDEIDELTRIAKWYQRSANKPSEHETVAYLIVPLLRALGWTPQRMAVEWNHVDVALFEQLPREDKSLRVVVEAKKMDNACLAAKRQAMSYADGKTGCKRLIVTDGLRYGVYVRHETKEIFRLHAYLNLTRLRRNYPIYECEGAEDALLAMAPEWKPL
jgi:hypothetical protein